MVNHKEYQAAVDEEWQQLENDLGYHTQEEADSDDRWENNNKKDIMIITPAALKELCSSTLTPLNEYDTQYKHEIQDNP